MELPTLDLEREKRFHELLGQALDLDPGQRPAFLAAACEGDYELLRALKKAVLQSRDTLDDFLEHPAVVLVTDAPTEPLHPEKDAAGKANASSTDWTAADSGWVQSMQVGPYVLREIIGTGGMGRVFLAEQQRPVHRRVALKVMRANLVGDTARARFDAERQALARLAHPHIGQIFDAGTTDEGFPYFVMELVEGVPLTHYCDREELPIEERIELMVAVCRGVEHAHRKQILHRDLKPSNILVTEIDGQPHPKIIDFGIAKALDTPLVDVTLATQGGMLGTPAYMSPEAIDGSGDIDTRSDVYSLGILLYELLVGTRPFETRGSSLPRVARRILEEDAPRPSTRLSDLDAETQSGIATRRRIAIDALQRRLENDLDWIVLKALAKNRDERYGSASELAADLERFLRDEPVVAGPPGLRYRMRKLLHRHRAAVIAALVVAVALVLGIAGTTFGMVRAFREAELARNALAETQAVSRFLLSVFAQSDPWQTSQGEALTAREILDRGAGEVRTAFPGQPLARARFMDTISDVYFEIGLLDEAAALREEALTIRRDGLPADDPEIAASLYDLAFSRQSLGADDQAENLWRQALAIRERELGPDHPDTAVTLMRLGMMISDRGELDEAERLLTRSVTALEAALGPEHPDLATALRRLGETYIKQGRLDEAEPLLRRAQEIQEKALGSEDPQVVNGLQSLAALAEERGRLEESAALHRRALDIIEKVLGPDHARLVRPLSNLGGLLARLERFDESERLLKRALAIQEATVGPEHIQVAAVLSNLASLYLKQGRNAETLPMYERALAIAEKTVAADHPGIAAFAFNLGLVHKNLGDLATAEPHYQRALAIREKVYGAEHPEVARVLDQLADLRRKEGRGEEAEALYRRALAIHEKAAGPDHPDVANVLRDLANLYHEQGRLAEAENLAQRSLAIFEQTFGPEHQKVATALAVLGQVYAAEERFDDAEPALRRALAIRDLANDHHLPLALRDLADLYRRQQRYDEAEPLYRRAVALWEEGRSGSDEARQRLQAALADLLRTTGRDG